LVCQKKITRMKAVGIKNGKGGIDALYIDDSAEKPTPSNGQVLVRVRAFGLNRMDLYQREGHYPVPPQAPKTLGVEFAGTVADANGSTEFKVGERVYGLVPGGAYAEYVAASVNTLSHLPDELTFVQGAGIPEVWYTASQLIHFVGGLEKNGTVLFHAGSSGVGIAALQIAQVLGAKRIFATVGSDDKKDFLKTLVLKGLPGDTIVPINYHSEDFAEVIKQHNTQVDLVADPVGQSYFKQNVEITATDGTIVLFGFMSGSVVDQVDFGPIQHKRISIVGTALRSRSPQYQQRIRDFINETFIPKFISKECKLLVDSEFDISEIAEAHKLLESNKTMGKIIVRID